MAGFLSHQCGGHLGGSGFLSAQCGASSDIHLLPQHGFGLWSGLDGNDAFLTAYVAHFLIEAQEHGVKLPAAWITPNGLFNKAVSALERLSRPDSSDDLPMLRQRAYATYLLARLGQVPSDSLMSIRSLLDRNFKAEE